MHPLESRDKEQSSVTYRSYWGLVPEDGLEPTRPKAEGFKSNLVLVIKYTKKVRIIEGQSSVLLGYFILGHNGS